MSQHNQITNNQPINQLDNFDFIGFIIKCFRRWYWFIVSVLLFASLTLFYLVSTTLKYDVTAAIHVHEEAGLSSNLGGLSGMLSLVGLGGNNVVEDEKSLIGSRTYMLKAISELDIQTEYRIKDGLKWQGQYPENLYSVKVEYPPMFCDTTKRGVEMRLSRKSDGYYLKVKYNKQRGKYKFNELGEKVSTIVGDLRIMPVNGMEVGDKITIKTPSMLKLADTYSKGLSIGLLNKDGNIISFSIRTDMPQREKDFINKLIDLYDLDAITQKNMQASQMLEFVNERLAIVSCELDSVERAAEKYMRDNEYSGDISQEAKMYLDNATTYKAKIVEIETQINLVDYIKGFVENENNRYAAIPANLGLTDNALVSLIGQYNTLLLDRTRIQHSATQDNPILEQLDERLNSIRNNIVTSIKSVKDGLIIMRDDAMRQDKLIAAQIDNVPEKEREFIQIRREQTIKQTVYLYLYQQREETLLALSSKLTPAKIINAPERSPLPVAPRKLVILFMSIIFGGVVPIVLILLLDFFSSSIGNGKEYQLNIRMRIIGSLTHHSSSKTLVANDPQMQKFTEQFRLLRTNLLYKYPEESSRTIIVTSAISNEGKTYVAVNTAYTLAMMHKKVVIIGLDLRTPALADVFHLNSRGKLTEYLTDENYSINDILFSSNVHKYLDVIPAGEITGIDVDAVLQANKLRELISTLRKQYDYIILDTAPVITVSDTLLINDIADVTIFVSRVGLTPREAVDQINKLNEDKRLPNMLGVINDLTESNTFLERVLGRL